MAIDEGTVDARIDRTRTRNRGAQARYRQRQQACSRPLFSHFWLRSMTRRRWCAEACLGHAAPLWQAISPAEWHLVLGGNPSSRFKIFSLHKILILRAFSGHPSVLDRLKRRKRNVPTRLPSCFQATPGPSCNASSCISRTSRPWAFSAFDQGYLGL